MSYVRYALCVILLFVSYLIGFNHAKTEGELEIESLKLAQAIEIIEAQKQVRIEYESQIQSLNAALASARSDGADGLRQLETFRGASRDMETCTRERNELAGLAVRGEELLKRADAYLGALVK